MSNKMITGPFEFIIGTSDLQETSKFLRTFGFTDMTDIKIDREAALALYGVAESQSQLLLSRVDTETIIRLVLTHANPEPMPPFAAGGHGIDFYTTDIVGAIEAAAASGGSRPDPVSWTIDTGRHLTEARIVSPDESFAVFCVSYSPGGIPTVLDHEPARIFSEVSLTSWIVPVDCIEEEFSFWEQAFGYRNIRRTMLAEGAMVDLMKLPGPAAMGCSMFADERPRCPVDLLWYPDRASSPREDWPLRPGLFALGFRYEQSESLDFHNEDTITVTIKESGGSMSTVLAGRSPGGIRYQIKI